jgi:hypothetical protein
MPYVLLSIVRSYLRLLIFSLLVGLIFKTNTTLAQQAADSILSKEDPDYINHQYNYIQFANNETIRSFFNKINNTNNKKVTIAHFGDSHIQLDHFVGTVRTLLQNKYGYAGRGMIFPYSIAKTYSQSDYKSFYQGRWISANSIQTPPKIPLGISGFIAKTNDSVASISIKFNKNFIKTNYIIKLFGNFIDSTYKVDFINGDQSMSNYALSDQSTGALIYNASTLSDSLVWKFNNISKDTNNYLTLHGISIETIDSSGVLYHNLGVGGAIFSALLHQGYFDKQFSNLNPDIVVLDWGTNDILYKNMLSDTLESTIIRTISRIRSIKPDISIILTSVQDMNWKGKNVSACLSFSNMIRKIAVAEKCLLYDWYYVAGGSKSMIKWEHSLLGRKDNVHLTQLGYNLKGKLFFEAIQQTRQLLLDSTNIEHLLIPPSESKVIQQLKNDQNSQSIPKTKKAKTNKYHFVKKGESLDAISKKYNVPAAKLKNMNQLRSNKLKPGTKLIIK